MIDSREVGQARYGAYRRARFDRTGHQHFDVSLDGFWRSFFAAVIVLPASVLLAVVEPASAEASVDAAGGNWLGRLVLHGLAYVLGWVALPFVMLYVSQALRRPDKFIGFIVAYNWAAVWQMAVMLLAVLIGWLWGAPGFLQLMKFFAVVAILVYQWFIAKTALGINGIEASGVVVLDLVLGLFITWSAGDGG